MYEEKGIQAINNGGGWKWKDKSRYALTNKEPNRNVRMDGNCSIRMQQVKTAKFNACDQ